MATGIRPLHDWLVVSCDPLPEVSGGGIVLPQGTSGQERVRTGTVLRVGPGKRLGKTACRQPVGVEPGARVAFYRENLEHQQGKQLVYLLQEFGQDLGLIRSTDILYVVEE